jgi:G3E family GTPase
VQAIPVIGLTGYLGAGKTSLLNHVLRSPGARIGVVINDFGELNVDAMLVTGQIDEPASIAGGCICCLPDDGGLDDALTKLADPELNLDAIIVEASGLADPVAIAQIIRFSGVAGVRYGGLVDVIDATTHFDTVDVSSVLPPRYRAASLVVVNKLDRLPHGCRAAVLERVEQRVRESNPHATVVGAIGAQIDPVLLYDVAVSRDEPGQLSLRELFVDAKTTQTANAHAHDHDHVHADSVTATSNGCIDPGAVVDLLEEPPAGVYRLKGGVAVRYRATVRTYAVNMVGTTIHIASAPPAVSANCLVAIGMHLDIEDICARLDAVLRPHTGPAPAANVRRLQRYRRLSI